VEALFPDLPDAARIRYRDLLRHRSGLVDYTRTADFERWRTEPQGTDAMLKRISAAGVQFAPGERVDYNNSNYLVLGAALERLERMSYAAIVQRRIVDRLGLSHTGTDADPEAARQAGNSYEFTPDGWTIQTPTAPGLHGGAGSLVSAPVDLVRFIDALFDGELVSKRSLALMRDADDGSGMGLWPYVLGGEEGFGHGGSVEGYRACVYHFPDRGLSLAYATNAPVLAMSEIVDAVLAATFDPAYVLPTLEPVTLGAHEQRAYAGQWRSAPGAPEGTPFRQFREPDQPIELVVAVGDGAPVGTIGGRDFVLVPFGGDEFLVREIGYFLRFYPQRGELVVRGPDWAYYLTRE
jgi:D-alanyl-D-alanine carboxypeptidase